MCKSTLRFSLWNIRYILVITMISIWISSCQAGAINIERKAQADITPPVITDLVFPTSGSILPEGSVVITGTLLDPAEEGSGFNRDHPVYLDIEVWGSPFATTWLAEPARTQRFIVNNTYPEHPDPSFFDWETGDFRIEFGNYLRLKPGRLVFHLYGEDVSGNVFGPITSNVLSGDVPGAPDVGQLYSARQDYGSKLLSLIDAFINCLVIFGEEYEDDIAVLNELHNYVQNTYVTNPVMETWSSEFDTLVANIHQMEYPDPIVQLGMNEAVGFLRDTMYYGHHLVNTYPYYPIEMSIPEIVELRQETVNRYTDDIFTINFMPLTPPAQGVSCHIFLKACDLPLHEDSMMNIADFTIIANPTQNLIMTGYIGWAENRVYLTPGDYDPPIKVLRLIGETAIEGTFTKFW